MTLTVKELTLAFQGMEVLWQNVKGHPSFKFRYKVKRVYEKLHSIYSEVYLKSENEQIQIHVFTIPFEELKNINISPVTLVKIEPLLDKKL